MTNLTPAIRNSQKDLRTTPLYQEAEAFYRSVRQPGTGQISDATEIHASPCGRYAVFSGTLLERLEGGSATRLCRVDLASADVRVITFGPHTDRLPRYSPDGRQIAFLSDRHEPGNFQLYCLDVSNGAARETAPVEGWVEYFHWSPDGRRILLAVAGHGADVAGSQGAVTSQEASDTMPAWMPRVETANEGYRWRSAWIYDVRTGRASQVSPSDCNIWEVAWCGNEALAAVASPGPGEGLWYTAHTVLIDINTGTCLEVRAPEDQHGCLASSPSGRYLAMVEGIGSDRWIVAGDLWLTDITDKHSRRVPTLGIDVTYTEWRSDRLLLLAGHRGLESVVAVYDAVTQTVTQLWASAEITTAGRFITVAGMGEHGDCALVGEGFRRSPEIAVLKNGTYQSIRSFDLGGTQQVESAVGGCDQLSWPAPDGLEIQGWLIRPRVPGPHPLVMYVHGGPVWHWRPMWLGRAGAGVLMLIRRGYAVFFPNPRGSTGRGQEFARSVVRDMGGADIHDLLSGIDHLVEKRLADPERLGVTGVSYGGFMTSWLISQDSRFAAAVSVAPMINYVTQRLLSNIPDFVSLFMADTYTNPAGQYYVRSPLMHAQKVRTPTLNICGALDRSAPPEEAMQFHQALLENGVESVLITYPQEGHGIRKLPAGIDYAARLVGWFEDHLI
jgi:dipeptidyl aminopeptidase/acylaminoacyl peptidase